jgi:hypothetical protein
MPMVSTIVVKDLSAATMTRDGVVPTHATRWSTHRKLRKSLRYALKWAQP